MTTTDLEKARKAAEAAVAKLAEAEAVEAGRQAEIAAERAERQRELDVQFLRDWRDLEMKVRGEVVTPDQKADALESGNLVLLLADYMARRDAIQTIRSHAQICAQRVGQEHNISELRDVDPLEELRRWQEDAVYALKRRNSGTMAAEILARYEVE
ncbi:hypothetical protein ABZ490_01935 [Streptomyces sp. NPDC005811]|uniref:hypothetical protein n=1 Tax=Streptomyces sp. NPDC005811 TaxID=3154565 RepID=UPI0033F8D68D